VFEVFEVPLFAPVDLFSITGCEDGFTQMCQVRTNLSCNVFHGGDTWVTMLKLWAGTIETMPTLSQSADYSWWMNK